MDSPFCWPFRSKVGSAEGAEDDLTTQWRRIDQGQDLQGLGPGEEAVLAIANGHIFFEHDPGTNGGHFGDPYPMLRFDDPLNSEYLGAYFGHVRPVVPAGFYAVKGTRIAVTTTPGGGGAPRHWLELGFWGPSGPVGKGTGWTQAGQDMHDLLETAPVFVDPHPPEVTDVENIILITPESGHGTSYFWNTIRDTKRGVADQPTAQGFLGAGGKTFVMADAEIASIPDA